MALRWIFWAVTLNFVLPLAGAGDKPQPKEAQPRLRHKEAEGRTASGTAEVEEEAIGAAAKET